MISPEFEALRGRLRAMPAVDVAGELEKVLGEMDERRCDEALLQVYLDVLDEKAPMPAPPDKAAAYEEFLRSIK